MRIGEATWHDVECASYAADLPLWRELARERGDPILDLGCGSGRVALDLAGRGHAVTGLDSERALVDELARRARQRGADVDCVTADARSFSLDRRFALAIAPMQVAQLLGGAEGRRRMLEGVHAHLEPGGLFAVALADPFEGVPAGAARPPLPDVREQEGWVLSSTPVAVHAEKGAVAIERMRQAVSPSGDLSEALVTIVLDEVSAEGLEAEGAAAGYAPLPARHVPDTPDHVGSTVVLLEAR